MKLSSCGTPEPSGSVWGTSFDRVAEAQPASRRRFPATPAPPRRASSEHLVVRPLFGVRSGETECKKPPDPNSTSSRRANHHDPLQQGPFLWAFGRGQEQDCFQVWSSGRRRSPQLDRRGDRHEHWRQLPAGLERWHYPLRVSLGPDVAALPVLPGSPPRVTSVMPSFPVQGGKPWYSANVFNAFLYWCWKDQLYIPVLVCSNKYAVT